MNSDLNEGLTLVAFRKARRAQTDTDDETWEEGEFANTLNAFDVGDVRTTHAVCFPFPQEVADPVCANEQRTYTHEGSGNFRTRNVVPGGLAVRRLLPLECERLQGFPDGHTAITYKGKPAKDGPRYNAIGNSMAVNVMSWLGQRVEMVEGIQ